ncbi:MAG: fasciclin domain-containing protein [Desulfobulbia bacterium]
MKSSKVYVPDIPIIGITSAKGVSIDGANVVSDDIKADNGYIHVIDKVLLSGS